MITESEKVTFSNLRKTVVALSNPGTPLEVRRRFYDNNPIPGAKWYDYLLQNPNEIIPDNYVVRHLSDDMDDIQPKIDFLAKKMPKYFSEPINYELEGRKSLLSSNKQNRMRVRDRGVAENLNDYYRTTMRVDGDIDSYYNLDSLSAAEQLSATLCLLGERPLTAEAMYPAYVTRDERVCCQVSCLSYKEAKRIMSEPS